MRAKDIQINENGIKLVCCSIRTVFFECEKIEFVFVPLTYFNLLRIELPDGQGLYGAWNC